MWSSFWTGQAAARRRLRWLDASARGRFGRIDSRRGIMMFQGFGSQALPFFKALAFHQNKEWF